MTELLCSAGSCAHNNSRCCCLNSIDVGVNSTGTCCESFAKRRDGEFKDACHTPNPDLIVKCIAHNCIYNKTGICRADRISIAGPHASVMEQTRCESFTAR